MVEYHGWFTLRESLEEEDDETRLAAIVSDVSGEISLLEEGHRIVGMKVVNGVHMGWIGGCTNHRGPDIEEVFQLYGLIAKRATGSYGLLYIWDDECEAEGNEFRVWKLAKGVLVRSSTGIDRPVFV